MPQGYAHGLDLCPNLVKPIPRLVGFMRTFATLACIAIALSGCASSGDIGPVAPNEAARPGTPSAPQPLTWTNGTFDVGLGIGYRTDGGYGSNSFPIAPVQGLQENCLAFQLHEGNVFTTMHIHAEWDAQSDMTKTLRVAAFNFDSHVKAIDNASTSPMDFVVPADRLAPGQTVVGFFLSNATTGVSAAQGLSVTLDLGIDGLATPEVGPAGCAISES